MAQQGWISIHRQLQNHWLWDDKPFSKGQAWVDLLLLANYADKTIMLGNELVEIKAGSLVTSELKLMDRWGWSKTKVRAFLDVLEKDNMIKKESDRKKTTIIIKNYGLFQDSETPERLQKAQKKKESKPKNESNRPDDKTNIYSENELLNQAIIEFVSFRKSIKKPMSDHAINLMIGKLNKLSQDIDEQIEIINQSIMNGWSAVYPLKEKKSAKQTGFTNFKQRDYDMKAMERILVAQGAEAENKDPDVVKQAEALKQKMCEKYGKAQV